MTAAGTESCSNSKRGGERRSRSKNTLYYNDPPNEPQTSNTGVVWIASLLDSCASGMQLLSNTCADVATSQNYSNNTCSSNIAKKMTCQEDTENVENNNNNNNNKMNNIIYKQQTSHANSSGSGSNSRRKLFKNNNNNSSNNKAEPVLILGQGQDFAVLHDDFLESLLAEADSDNNNNNNNNATSSGSVSGSVHSSVIGGGGNMDESLSSTSSFSGFFSRLDNSSTNGGGGGSETTATAAAAVVVEEQEEILAQQTTAAQRKRRRPLRLRKTKTPPPPPPPSQQQQQHSYQSFAAQEGNRSNSNKSEQQHYTMNDNHESSTAVALHKRQNDYFNFSSSSTLDSTTTPKEQPQQQQQQQYQEPSVFLHEHVRMQKDKGKGEAVGSNICAKGRHACLQKLRAKMRLLTEVALKDATSCSSTTTGTGTGTGGYIGGGGGGGSSSNASTTSSVITVSVATMKRKPARIALQTETFCETRSLIELKMGFLSMTYGVLLRWDITRTRTITLVVLRKNVHYESFYPPTTTTNLQSSVTSSTTSSNNNEPTAEQQHPYKRHKDFSNSNASSNNSSPSSLLKNNHDTLDPPYFVPRPLDLHLQPTILHVSVLYATGLNKRCNWTIQLLLQGRVESILLAYDSDRDNGGGGGRLYPKLGEALRHELSNISFPPCLTTKLLPPPLEIKLWEHTATASRGVRHRIHQHHHHKNNNNSRKLVCAMRVSWDDLPISTSSSDTKDSTLVTVPCLHDVENATIGLDVLFQSDYLYWLRQELLARRGYHHQGQAPSTSIPVSSSTNRSSLLCTSSRELFMDGYLCSPLLPSCTTSTTTNQYQGRCISPPTQQRDEVEEEEDINSPWEWICSVC